MGRFITNNCKTKQRTNFVLDGSMVDLESEHRRKLPLEITLTDSNMQLVDYHKNARGNAVLKFRNKSTGDTRTYPNVNTGHLSPDLKMRLQKRKSEVLQKPTQQQQNLQQQQQQQQRQQQQQVYTPSVSQMQPFVTIDPTHIPTVQLPLYDTVEHAFDIPDSHVDEPRDGIQFILNDHETVRQLFKLIDGTRDFTERKQLTRAITREICLHASAEEQLVYPLMRQFLPLGDDIANRFITDDQCNKLVLTQLESMASNMESEELLYMETLKKFVSNELQHMKDEEIYLAELKKRLNNEMLAALYDNFVLAKSTAPTHPHPELPVRPEMGSNILQPVTGQADRMIDDIVDMNLNS